MNSVNTNRDCRTVVKRVNSPLNGTNGRFDSTFDSNSNRNARFDSYSIIRTLTADSQFPIQNCSIQLAASVIAHVTCSQCIISVNYWWSHSLFLLFSPLLFPLVPFPFPILLSLLFPLPRSRASKFIKWV